MSLFINFFKELLDCDSTDKKSENEFFNSLCKSCANFSAYIVQILTQERSFVLQEETFSFLKQMAAKIKESSMLTQVSAMTSSLISDIIRQDPTVHELKDFQSLLKVS